MSYERYIVLYIVLYIEHYIVLYIEAMNKVQPCCTLFEMARRVISNKVQQIVVLYSSFNFDLMIFLMILMVFLMILTVGFVYEWKKGALEWD